MFALIAAILFILVAIPGIGADDVLFYLGLASWALHFAFSWPLPLGRGQ